MPTPKPQSIHLSEHQQSVLEKMVRRQTSPQQLVRRVQIILQMAQGKNNQQVGREMSIHRETVRQWRQRWLDASERLSTVEARADDKQLMQLIESVLADELRPGAPAHFSLEQIVEILAIACEKPDASGYPLSHWTPQALRVEAVKRGIVEQISVRQVGRFLKGGSTTTAPESLLAIALTLMTQLHSRRKLKQSATCIKRPPICTRYGIHVISTDEMTRSVDGVRNPRQTSFAIQALERAHLTQPMRPNKVELQEARVYPPWYSKPDC